MAWVAVDKNGDEYVYSYKPYRECCEGVELWMSDEDYVELPKGSIKKLIGKELNWNDEPLSLHDEFYMETSVYKELAETMKEFLEKAQNTEDVFHHNLSRTQELWDSSSQYAKEKAKGDFGMQLALRLAFQMGAKWADEHPKKSYK